MEFNNQMRYACALSIMIVEFSQKYKNRRYTASEIAAFLNPKSVRKMVIKEADLFDAFQEVNCRRVLLNLFPEGQIEFQRYSFEKKRKYYGVSFNDLQVDSFPNGVPELTKTIFDRLSLELQVYF